MSGSTLPPFLNSSGTGPSSPRPHVVVVGGGFGGLYAARALAPAGLDVTLIDRHNYHLFQPLLYQVASAALSAGDIAAPIRSLFRRYKNVRVLMGEVTDFDLAGKRVMTTDGDYRYEYLVVAAGATGTYFGHDDWAQFAPGLKGIEDAIGIRRRIFCAYETAESHPEGSEMRNALMTFVVIGGGATGVEMAGAIVEIATKTLRQDFRSIDPTRTRVILLQSGSRILPDYPGDLSDSARTQLERLGVEVRTGWRVTNITAEGVTAGDQFIPSKTVIWAAGVRPSPLGAKLGVPLDKAGRVLVDEHLALPDFPNVFVVGDLAHVNDKKKGTVPGIASAAIQEGVAAGRNIVRLAAGGYARPFVYDDRGQLATIGRNSAVGIVKGIPVKGFIAWVMWLLVHIYFLIGFENRMFVLLNWAYSYLSYNKSARIITGGSGAEAS